MKPHRFNRWKNAYPSAIVLVLVSCSSPEPNSGDSGFVDSGSPADVGVDGDLNLPRCVSFSSEACPTDRCQRLDGIVDLSADRKSDKPTCDGEHIELCTELGDGASVSVVAYRDANESPSAVLLPGGFFIEGWTTCPAFQEQLDGSEPPVCLCAFE